MELQQTQRGRKGPVRGRRSGSFRSVVLAVRSRGRLPAQSRVLSGRLPADHCRAKGFPSQPFGRSSPSKAIKRGSFSAISRINWPVRSVE